MYLKFVIWEVGYGEGFHECCSIGQKEDCDRCAQVLYYRPKPGCSMPCDSYCNIGERMVKAEVCMRHEVQWYRHLHGHTRHLQTRCL